MTTTNQFWALVKFQGSINPYLWFLPLAFGFPLILPYIGGGFGKSYHPDFFLLTFNQNLFFIGIFAAALLAPERFQFGTAAQLASIVGTEFVMTRAVDRSVVYRVRAIFFYTLVAVAPCLGLLHALATPDLVVTEYSKEIQHTCLASIPGSVLLPPESGRGASSLISIPGGNVLAGLWQLLLPLAVALMTQGLMQVLYPFRYARVAFWVLFFSVAFAPLFVQIGSQTTPLSERLFFWFAAHPLEFWVGFAALFVVVQVWCERGFARMEF